MISALFVIELMSLKNFQEKNEVKQNEINNQLFSKLNEINNNVIKIQTIFSREREKMNKTSKAFDIKAFMIYR